MSGCLRIHGARGPDGEVRSTFLLSEGEEAAVLVEGAMGAREVLPLPTGAIAAVFARYGRPLEAGLAEDARGGPFIEVSLPPGRATLHAFPFRPFGWVLPADYLALFPAAADASAPGEPLAAPAPLCAAALAVLGRAAQQRQARPV